MSALLLPKEAAARLSVSLATLARLVDDGKLSYIDVGTRTRRVHRFKEEELDSFLKRREKRELPKCASKDDPRQGIGVSCIASSTS